MDDREHAFFFLFFYLDAVNRKLTLCKSSTWRVTLVVIQEDSGQGQE